MILATVRESIADYVAAIIVVYIILIFIRILISYIPRIPYNMTLRAVLDFVTEVTEPYIAFFRRFIPMVRLGGMGLDLSPTVGVIVLFVLLSILPPIIAG